MNREVQVFILERINQEFADPATPELGNSIARLLGLHLEELDEWAYAGRTACLMHASSFIMDLLK